MYEHAKKSEVMSAPHAIPDTMSRLSVRHKIVPSHAPANKLQEGDRHIAIIIDHLQFQNQPLFFFSFGFSGSSSAFLAAFHPASDPGC